MALKKQLTYKGFETEAYAKIVGVTIIDYLDGETKKYKVNIVITKYTNKSKEFDYEQTNEVLDGFSEAELTYDKFYDRVKAVQFENWENC